MKKHAKYFWEGVASIFNLFPETTTISVSVRRLEEDPKRLNEQVWQMTGEQIRAAMEQKTDD